MSVDPELQHQPLPEQKQPPLLPTSSQPSIHADGVVEGARDGAGDESEKPGESTAPSTSLFDVDMPQLPPIFRIPVSKKRHRRRKKDPLTPKQRATACRKLESLTHNFHPLPFSPGKTLDFSAHENLFRELGLWDFAHLKLDSEVRSDLLIDLISYYDPVNRRSYVHDIRIYVNRSYLARALGLPAKKVKANALECMDETATSVLLQFISNYMPYGDDMCILPSEIMQAIQFVKEGLPQMVDWAALMWVLVEKELCDVPNSGICYCASHLQCLIKHQKPRLFQKKGGSMLETIAEAEEDEILVVEAEGCVADDEDNVVEDKLNVVKEEDAYNDRTMKMKTLEDLENTVFEKNNGELPLLLGEEDNVTGDFEEAGEDKQLFEEVKNESFDHCFGHCAAGVSEGINLESFTEVDELRDQEMKHGDEFSEKVSNLVGLSPSVLQAMGNTSYAQKLSSFNEPTGEFVTMGTDSHKNGLGHGPSVCLYSGNNGKRLACAMSDVEEHHFELNHEKRTRSSEPWGNLTLSPYDLMGQMQGNAERLKMLYAEKNQALVNMQLQTQYLNHVLQEKEQAICSLKIMLEDKHRTVVRQYDYELFLMKKMLHGYKKSLKDTLINFSDYKRKHSEVDEPLCKDVSGTSGMVLSVGEIEQKRLEKDEEARQKLLGTFGVFKKVLLKFEECEERIMMHNKKLAKLAGEIEQLKERFVKV